MHPCKLMAHILALGCTFTSCRSLPLRNFRAPPVHPCKVVAHLLAWGCQTCPPRLQERAWLSEGPEQKGLSLSPLLAAAQPLALAPCDAMDNTEAHNPTLSRLENFTLYAVPTIDGKMETSA